MTSAEGQLVDAVQADHAREHWIPVNDHQVLYILQPTDLGSGTEDGDVLSVENHFEAFVQQNRQLQHATGYAGGHMEVIVD